MDAYHAPFTPKHRYWLGLLLFSLIAYNIIAAFATDTYLPIISAGCIAIGICFFKLIVKKVHKTSLGDLIIQSYDFSIRNLLCARNKRESVHTSQLFHVYCFHSLPNNRVLPYTQVSS